MAPRTDSNTGHGDANGVATRLALASVSASLSEIVTFPIDTVKTRLQLLRASSVSTSSNLLLVSRNNRQRRRFPRLLQRPLSCHVFYTPIRIVGYENLRGFAVGADGEVSLFGKALAGGALGVFAQVVASPADLVKVRMQANPAYTQEFMMHSQK